jgi:flagellar biosynthesis protein FlhF
VNLKTYQAFTMAQALAAVKQDLGSDAIILNTRTFRRGGVWGIGAKLIVEVTATPAEPQVTTPRPSSAKAAGRPMPAVAQKAYGSNIVAKSSDDPDRERVKRLALAMEESHRRQVIQPSASPVPTDAFQIKPSPTMFAIDPKPEKPVAVPWPTAARRFVLASPETSRVPDQTSPLPPIGKSEETRKNRKDRPPRRPKTPGVVTDAMQSELTAIKALVGQVLQQQVRTKGTAGPAMPKALFEMYLKLVAQDVSDELADQVVNAVQAELALAELENEAAVRAAVLKHLAAFIPAASEPCPAVVTDGRPLTIVLVGPTGVGKTTTVAKLAATFKLRHGKKVGLITADTYRIAAVEQLRTYASIIGIPLQVVASPADMKQAVESLSNCDVVLIDTAGRSQNDENRIAELTRIVTAADPHEVHLVLSSTAGEKVLLKEAEVFSEVGIHRVVLTKLDEAVSFGMLVNVIRQVGKQLSFVTTGQEVPEHLECGRGERLAALILGAPVHEPSINAMVMPA